MRVSINDITYNVGNMDIDFQRKIGDVSHNVRTQIQEEVSKYQRNFGDCGVMIGELSTKMPAIQIKSNTFVTATTNAHTHSLLSISTDTINSSSSLNIPETIEQLYKIDQQGYLLDHNNYYILNKNCKKLKLKQEHILMLNQYGILNSQSPTSHKAIY